MRILPILAATMAMTALNGVKAEDQTDFQFDQGSTLVQCTKPEGGEQIPAEVFNEAFPLWMTALQQYANDGIISRAHYLNELKDGIFIVVIGKDKQESGKNAEEVMETLRSISVNAFTKVNPDHPVDGIDPCKVNRIGPVAILPIK